MMFRNRILSKARYAFTLIELLVAISIIGVLASMVLVMVRGVQLDAQVSKSRSTVNKIGEVLASKYEQLLTAPMSVTIPERAMQQVTVSTGEVMPRVIAKEAALVRLIAMRDLMRMVLPIRHEDLPVETHVGATAFTDYYPPTMVQLRVLDPGVAYPRVVPFDSVVTMTDQEIQQLTNSIPAESYAIMQSMISRFVTALPQKGVSPPNSTWWTNNENAELLYAIVESTVINGSSALELFKSSEIGDTDSDNCPEFIDAFGTPIGFVRWPAGSPMAGGSFMVDPFGSGDPFDPLRADVGYDPTTPSGGFMPGKGLFPLVVSAGANGLFGVNGIEARKPDFASGTDVWTDKVLFSLGESLPAEFGLPQDAKPLAVVPGPSALSGSRYSLNSVINSVDLPVRAYGDFRRDGYLYPDPYIPRANVPANVPLRAGFPWYPDAAADNITNLDQGGESL